MNNKKIEKIFSIKNDFHKVGTLGEPVLRRIHKYATKFDQLHTAETGSGQSTLYFSQVSNKHTVFALNDVADVDTNSVSSVKISPLFNSETVDYVLGPTQITLPSYTFTWPLDIVLIDGPHAYPFPELEYYYLYPHLRSGGLLVLDDIHIPTIAHLFSFLAHDSMFDLVDIVAYTAFFIRTSSEIFPIDQDNWWLQRYNVDNKKYLLSALQHYKHETCKLPFTLKYGPPDERNDGSRISSSNKLTDEESLSDLAENNSEFKSFRFRFKIWLYDTAKLFLGHGFAVSTRNGVRRLLGKEPSLD